MGKELLFLPLTFRTCLLNFCFAGGENKYITVNSYEVHWIKNIKDAVAYLFLNCSIAVGPKIFSEITGIPIGPDTAPLFANLYFHFYESKWMNKLKKDNLIKAGKRWNIFSFINDLYSISDAEESKTNYCSVYPGELVLGKRHTDKH